MIDFSFYGIKSAACHALTVLAWVAGSTATGEVINKLVAMLTAYQTLHPETILYTGALIGGVNVLGVFLVKWWGKIDPEKAAIAAGANIVG